MQENFLDQNKHLENPERFRELDPHLSSLKQYSYTPPLLNQLPINTNGIYTLTGGGLVGKTTLIKLWIDKLLASGVPAQTIHYYSPKIVDNFRTLIEKLNTQLTNNTSSAIQYVVLDDVTRDSSWDKAIKYVIDNGLLKNVVLIVISADAAFIKKLKTNLLQRTPGFNTTDFHLYPLSFYEFIATKTQHAHNNDINVHEEFNHYLLHGGYHAAIRDFTLHGTISNETFQAYSNWLVNEIRQQEKQESFLREILQVIITYENHPVTWNALTRELSIHHPKTIGDYIAQLEALDAIVVQSALSETSLAKAPKRARKLMFFDPFIYHAIRAYLQPSNNIFKTQVLPLIKNPKECDVLVETCVVSHFSRHFATYYLQDEGHINLAYLYDGRFRPVLIAWSNELHAKDLKQILKYPNGKILTKSMKSGMIDHIRTEPLPLALLKLHD